MPDGRRRRLLARIVRTRYYRRDQLYKALVKAHEANDAEEAAQAQAPEAAEP